MMKDLETIRLVLQQQLPLLTNKYKVESLGVFGSYVRDEQSSDSDLDLLVTFSETPGLLQLIQMENYLSDLFELKVDLVMKTSLKPRLSQQVLAEVVLV